MSLESEKLGQIKDVYEMYRNDVYRFARYIIGDSSSAYDVVQEVFMRAIRSWDNFRHDSNTKTWLLSITRNYIYDSFRKQKRWEKFLGEYTPLRETEIDTMQSIETTMVLEKMLTELKDSYRQVFVLRHIENLTVQETASVLKWSEGKVRITDHRAIARLRELLRANYGEVNLLNE